MLSSGGVACHFVWVVHFAASRRGCSVGQTVMAVTGWSVTVLEERTEAWSRGGKDLQCGGVPLYLNPHILPFTTLTPGPLLICGRQW